MEKILTEHSTFQPILAEGGEQGWKMITQQPPDAVILDLFMPDLDGFTITGPARPDDIPGNAIANIEALAGRRPGQPGSVMEDGRVGLAPAILAG